MNQEITIKIDDETLKGKYSNALQCSHTKEEFILDFINLFPPTGIITARVITSPSHLKRVIAVLQENLKIYEENFGKIAESEPLQGKIGFKTE